MKLQLTNGSFTVVDAEMYPILSQYKWRESSFRGMRYAVRTFRTNKEKPRVLFMHHLIVGYPLPQNGKRMVVDHKNGQSLENTRANLRIISQRENALNNKSRRKAGV